MTDYLDRAINHSAACKVRDDGACTCSHRDRLRGLERSSLAPGEGTWSVFAEKVVRERDELQARLGEILGAEDICSKVGRPCLKCMESFGQKLAKVESERDVLASRLAHAEADAEQAIHHEQVQRAEAVSAALDERNVARSERDEARRERDEALALLAKMRGALSDYYSECKCEHEAIDAVNMRAYRALHEGRKP